jgi:DNA-directed RNA polymerase subunit RPC12/RpoP
MIAKCPCDHCGKNIEFATEEFLSGSSVACPHCGKETFLSVSPKSKPAVSSLSKLPPPKPTAPPPAPPRYVTCRCQYCDKGIEFDANRLDVTGTAGNVLTGQKIACPHCGLETILFIPNDQRKINPQPAKSAPPPKEVVSQPPVTPQEAKPVTPPQIQKSSGVSRSRLWLLIGALALGGIGLLAYASTYQPSDKELQVMALDTKFAHQFEADEHELTTIPDDTAHLDKTLPIQAEMNGLVKARQMLQDYLVASEKSWQPQKQRCQFWGTVLLGLTLPGLLFIFLCPSRKA